MVLLMKSVNGYTEEEILAIIDRVVKTLAKNFTFGYYDDVDLHQEGFIFALEGIEKFDSKRPLENFLYSHIRNRFSNLRRNKFSRLEPPCKTCPFFDPHNKISKCGNECTAYEDKMECSRWAIFINRNFTKRNLNEPITIGDVDDEMEEKMKDYNDPSSPVLDTELIDKINNELDATLRSDFIKLMAGSKLPKIKREKVQKAIEEILYGTKDN